MDRASTSLSLTDAEDGGEHEVLVFHELCVVDLRRVIDGGSWTYDGGLLLMHPLKQGDNPQPLQLYHVVAWFRVLEILVGLLLEVVINTCECGLEVKAINQNYGNPSANKWLRNSLGEKLTGEQNPTGKAKKKEALKESGEQMVVGDNEQAALHGHAPTTSGSNDSENFFIGESAHPFKPHFIFSIETLCKGVKLLTTLNDVRVVFINRVVNSVTHCLVRASSSFSSRHLWGLTPSHCIISARETDLK